MGISFIGSYLHKLVYPAGSSPAGMKKSLCIISSGEVAILAIYKNPATWIFFATSFCFQRQQPLRTAPLGNQFVSQTLLCGSDCPGRNATLGCRFVYVCT